MQIDTCISQPIFNRHMRSVMQVVDVTTNSYVAQTPLVPLPYLFTGGE